MKPVEKIHTEMQRLQWNISELIKEFEMTTGASVFRVDLCNSFFDGRARPVGIDLDVTVSVELPPATKEAKQV